MNTAMPKRIWAAAAVVGLLGCNQYGGPQVCEPAASGGVHHEVDGENFIEVATLLECCYPNSSLSRVSMQGHYILEILGTQDGGTVCGFRHSVSAEQGEAIHHCESATPVEVSAEALNNAAFPPGPDAFASATCHTTLP